MRFGRRDFLKISASAAFAAGVIGFDTFRLDASEKDSEFFRPDLIADASFIDLSNDQAYIAGYPVSWWEQHYGMPLHIQYAGQIRKNIRAFKQVLKDFYPKSDIRYAAKACTHPSVFRIVNDEGAGVDAASFNEMQAALDGGINPQRIDVNCNAKTDELIRTAIDKNMMLVANDVTEYLLISEIALAMKKSPKVMLRISGLKSGKSLDYHVTTAGYWTKFGCPLDEVPGFFAIMKSHQHLDFQGFHVHIGSQVTEAAPFLFALGKLIGISRECNSRGRRCEAINIGGGYPVSYLTREQWGNILNMALAGHKRSVEGDNSGLWIWGGGASGFQYRGKGRNKTVRYAGKQYFCEHAKEDMLREILKGSVNVDGKSIGTVNALKEIGEPMLVIEPGRSIVEDSGITLVGVVSTRKMYGIHNLVTVNAGEVNFAAAMSGMPMNVWENATYLKIRDINPFEAFVAGQLCFSSDMLAKVKIELQHEPKKGEILMIRDTGAYDSQFFTANTNSFPRPARLIAMENGSVECLKKRDTYEDIFSI